MPELQLSRLMSDEGVPRQPLPALHALEQEARLTRRAQQRVGANRGEHVGKHLPVDRDELVACGQRPRVSWAGEALSHLFWFPLSAPLSAAGPERKRYQNYGLALAFISRLTSRA